MLTAGEYATVVDAISECTTVSHLLFASFAEEHARDDTEGCRLFDVANPGQALNDVSSPQSFTHKPARHDCPDCITAKRIQVRNLAGMSTIVAEQHGDMLTRDHSNHTAGFGPAAIGGRQIILCIKERAFAFGYVGMTKRTDGDAVAYHVLHAVGSVTVGMVDTDGGRVSSGRVIWWDSIVIFQLMQSMKPMMLRDGMFNMYKTDCEYYYIMLACLPCFGHMPPAAVLC